jgi:hypothetical protein
MDQKPVPTSSPLPHQVTQANDGMSTPRASTTSREAIADMMRLETELVAWERSGPHDERPARAVASEEIRTARKRRQAELHLTGLTELPSCVRELEYLESLTLTACAIRTIDVLPRKLRHLEVTHAGIAEIATLPDSLQTLNLGNNRIEKLDRLPPALHTLHLECNKLDAIPELPQALINLYLSDNNLQLLPELPAELQMLDVHANQLIALPEIPTSILMLDATSNFLRDIPDSLTQIDRPWKVVLEHNPLSQAVLDRIEGLLQSRPGPELFMQREGQPEAPNNHAALFKVSAVSGTGLLLEPQVDYWCTLAGLQEDDAAALRKAWAKLEAQVTPDQDTTRIMPLVRILEALQTIAAEEPRPVREMMAERIAILLEDIAGEHTLLPRILDATQAAKITLQGKPVAALHALELTKEQSNARKAGHDCETLIVLGNKIHAEAVLAELVEESAAENILDASIDDLTFAYRIRLYRLMWIPEPSREEMQWAIERVTNAQADSLAKELETRLGDPEMRTTFFTEWEPWLTYLHSQMPPELHTALMQMMEHMDRLNEKWATLEIKLELATAMVGEDSASALAIQDERDALEDEYQRIQEDVLLPVRRMLTTRMLGTLPI